MKTNKIIFDGFKLLSFFIVLCGGLYTGLVFLAGQALFPAKAEGSLLKIEGKIIGSELIGQKFSGSQYFHPRPSAIDYNPYPSGASNLGWTSSDLQKQFTMRAAEFRNENKLDSTVIVPSEMLFTSGSGVDPHISVDAAKMQAKRIAAERKPSGGEQQINKLIDDNAEFSVFNLSGGSFVNVNLLNIQLDNMR